MHMPRSLHTKAADVRRRRRWLALSACLFCLVLAGLGYLLLRIDAAEAQLEIDRLDEQAARAAGEVNRRLEQDTRSLVTTGRFIEQIGNPDAWQFASFVSPYLDRYERFLWVTMEGMPDYMLKPHSLTRVVHVAPASQQADLEGVDVLPQHRALLEAASHTGRAVVSDPAWLADGDTAHAGFVAAVAVRESAGAGDVGRLRGFVVTSYGVEALTALIGKVIAPYGMTLASLDLQDDERPAATQVRDGKLRYRTSLNLGARHLLVTLEAPLAERGLARLWPGWLAAGLVAALVGCLFYILVSRRDYAERVASRRLQELRQARHYLNDVLRSASSVAIISTDLRGRIQLFNHGAELLLGYPAEDVVDRQTPLLFHDPAEAAARRAELRADGAAAESDLCIWTAVAAVRGSETRRWTFLRRDGERRRVDLTVNRLDDLKGVCIGFLGVAADVTEQERSTLALLERDRLLAKLSENVPGVIYQFQLHPDGRTAFPYASAMLRDLYQLEPHAVRDDARPAFALIHPDDLAEVMDSIDRSAAALAVWRADFRVCLPDGRVRWHRGESRPERLVDGSILWHGFITDITEHKQLELRLRQQAAAIEATSHGVMIADAREAGFPLVFANAAFCRITGCEPGEVLGRGASLLQGHDASTETCARLREALASGQSFRDVLLNYRKDGAAFWSELTLTPLRDERGDTAYFVGIVDDITRRVLAEQELKQSRERFDLAVAGSNDGIWDWNLASGEQYVSPRYKALLDYLPDEVAPALAVLPEALHPDDDRRVSDALGRHFGQGEPFDLEYRLRARAGNWKWFHVRGKAVFGPDGKPVRMAGSISDITERIQAETRLRASEHKFRHFFVNSPVAMARIRVESGRFVEANRAFAALVGCGVEQLAALGLDAFTPAGQLPLHRELADVFAARAHLGPVERTLELAAQQAVVVLLHGFPADEDEEEGESYWLIAENITETKHLQAQLEHLTLTDPLTHSHNRRSFNIALEREVNRTTRYGNPLALISFDLDHFKAVNDTYGHDVGDQVLVRFCDVIRDRIRETDTLFRLGGEEFVLLCPDTPLAQATELALELLEAIRGAEFAGSGHLTASLGVAQFLPDESPDQTLKRLDMLMYKAKHGGRNRVCTEGGGLIGA